MKRRFIRQNREIARINSGQSVRIRNLETEISRLLAENITLRGEAIHAKAETENRKAAQKLDKEVVRIKEQLEEKLSGVHALLGELGALPDKFSRRSSQRRRKDGFVSDLVKSTEDREPRHRQTLCEQEGRLPAILEDKHYPRRTLESSEVQALKDDVPDDATESPELGPPPVAHFDEAEAVTFNARRSPRRTSTELIDETERSSRTSTVGIENRRKRRISTLLHSSDLDKTEMLETEDAKAPEVEQEPVKKAVPAQPQSVLKTGAKRKLEVSELEDTSRVSKELDDFIFQRRAAVPAATTKPSRFSKPAHRESQENTNTAETRSPERLEQPARRILAPKSTNSPTKRRTGASNKSDAEKNEDKMAKPERRVVSRVRARPTITDVSLRPELPAEDEDDDLGHVHQAHMPPKTPAAGLDNVTSPASTEPSMKHQPPKEMAFTHSVEDVLNGSIGRNSRRARAAVSYAEPNLRDKMRRPGKALVSAVEGIAKSQNDIDVSQVGSTSVDVGLVSARRSQEMNGSARKEEDPKSAEGKGLSGWRGVDRAQDGRSEPASPLRDKVAPGAQNIDRNEDYLNKAVSRLSVTDPPTSSPAAAEQEETTVDATRVDRHTSRSRRQSFQPSSTQQSAIESKPNSSTVRTRRPTSVSEVRPPVEAEADQSKTIAQIKRSASVSTLPNVDRASSRATSRARLAAAVNPPTSDIEDQGGQRHRDGALSRRRSTLV